MNPVKWTFVLIAVYCNCQIVIAQLRSYETIELSVGAIIDKDDVAQEICFKKSVQEANKLLQKHEPTRRRIQLVPVIETIDGDDSFQASQKACRLLERQVIAIYGPSSPNAVDVVQSLTTQFGIPHLQIDWGFRQKIHGFALNVHPHYLAYGQALYDYVRAAQWPSVALIYYKEESLLKYDYLIRTLDTPVRMRKWDVTNDNHRYVIKQFSKMQQQYAHFIVDIPFWEIQEFLTLIETYNMTSQFYRYIFTDWDIQLVDPEAFRAVGAANITTLSILQPMNEDKGYGIGALLDDIRLAALQDERFARSSTQRRISPTYSALLYDGLSLLAMGILSSSRTSDLLPPSGLTCSSSRSWNPGINLINDIKAIKPENFRGLTGTFQFDGHGWRSNVNFTILEFAMKDFRKYGHWNLESGLTITKNFSHTMQEIQSELRGKVLRITTMEEKPYMMYIGKTPPGKPKSTDPKDWQGFCIDLLNYISRDLNFSYTINLVPDSTYGNAKYIDGEEVWDGMVKELSNHKADLAVGSFTITYDRDRVIDFTTPFMYLGISIIYKRPEDKESHLFSFLQPLSAPVWGYILAATIMVSLVLFVVARFSPYEWKNKHPCNAKSNVIENNFNVLNSLWFTFGSLMQKGSDILPHATSTRIIAGFWWFFTLIVISSYTANLAAFLTVARMVSPIENVEDLSKQTKIKYGTIQGGSTEAFFAQSKFPIYERMYQFMTSQKGLMMNSTVEAIKRVKREEYAFLLESTMNEYYRQRDCDLMQVGGLLDSKGYGIGLPSGSKYRDPISETILKLQKQQILDNRRHFWWGQHNIQVKCDASTGKSSDTSSLGMDKVGGCFVMLLIGMGMSLLVSLLEFIYSSYQRARAKKRSIHEEMARDFRFATACSSMRSHKAEEAAVLPPPPSLLCTSKDVGNARSGLSAALAYAPCLPPPDLPLDLIAETQNHQLRVPQTYVNPESRLQSQAAPDYSNMIVLNPKGPGVNPNDIPVHINGTGDSGKETAYRLGPTHPSDTFAQSPNHEFDGSPSEDGPEYDEDEDAGVNGMEDDELELEDQREGQNVDDDDEEEEEEWLPGPSPDSPNSAAALGTRTGLAGHVSYPVRTTASTTTNIPTGSNNTTAMPKQDSQLSDSRLTVRNANDLQLKKVSC